MALQTLIWSAKLMLPPPKKSLPYSQRWTWSLVAGSTWHTYKSRKQLNPSVTWKVKKNEFNWLCYIFYCGKLRHVISDGLLSNCCRLSYIIVLRDSESFLFIPFHVCRQNCCFLQYKIKKRMLASEQLELLKIANIKWIKKRVKFLSNFSNRKQVMVSLTNKPISCPSHDQKHYFCTFSNVMLC